MYVCVCERESGEGHCCLVSIQIQVSTQGFGWEQGLQSGSYVALPNPEPKFTKISAQAQRCWGH